MSRTLNRPIPAAALLLSLIAACSDGPAAPKTGILEVVVRITGGDVDLDGIDVLMDASVRQFMFGNTKADFRNLSAGTHTLTLESVADNCTVQGGLPRSVTVSAGETVHVTVDIVCVATAIAVSTHVTGTDIQRTYQLVLNGQYVRNIDADSSLVLGRLQPGSYTVALIAAGDNCIVANSGRVTVDVSLRTTTPVRFEIECTPPVRLEEIAFTMDTVVNGAVETWVAVIRPDGSGKALLARGNSPSWSPDGSRLVFSTAVCVQDFYYYYTTCTGGLAVIDPETRNVDSPNAGGIVFTPSWAPRGNLIAFAGCCDFSGAPIGVYVFALDGSMPTRRLAPAGTTMARDPAWSPDGALIAFSCMLEPGNFDVCEMRPDGTGAGRLTSDRSVDERPAWSPDGKLVAFTSDGQVAIIPSGGGDVTRLTAGIQPTWSRDGTVLVFAGNGGLYTIGVSGSSLRRLTSGPHYAPAWRPPVQVR
jgi:WD40 repeat protein